MRKIPTFPGVVNSRHAFYPPMAREMAVLSGATVATPAAGPPAAIPHDWKIGSVATIFSIDAESSDFAFDWN